jgi:hypothetical protein
MSDLSGKRQQGKVAAKVVGYENDRLASPKRKFRVIAA